MVRLIQTGIIFFATFFAILFLASSPIRETYVAMPPPAKKIPLTIPESDGSAQNREQEKMAAAEDVARVAEAVSNISDIVADLQKKIAVVAAARAVRERAPSPEEINTAARAALVNIYCRSQSGETIRLATGSGVIIDPRGIILTNAHVAQNFLFENAPTFGNTDCIIRAGSPASPFYDAEILYISPSWIKENASSIKQENPRGTGEHDFALLHITRSIRNGISLPERFPALSPDMKGDGISLGKPVLLASYPAGFLGSATIEKDLYPASAVALIKEIFTFKTSSLDLFSVGGSVVAQKGSSGSGVVSLETGKLAGIIVTSTEGHTTADRDLQAITFSHMSESMQKDIGFSLSQFLSGDPAEESSSFQKNISPVLLQILSQ